MASKKFKLNFTFKTFIGLVLVSTFLFGAAVLSVIDSRVTSKLDGVLWTIPAKIYSRSLEIAEGGVVNKKNLLRELEMLSYQKVRKATDLGEYYYNGKNLNIFLRGHLKQSSGLYRITFEEGRVKSIENQGGSVVNSIILEPMAIGGMYPLHMEDRVLLDWPQIPDKLVKILLSVEDQGFFNHYGISLKSISRAFFRNIQAANIEQGGSTITQQLAKNLFFSSEQTLKRKVSEAIAALLIEFHYTKKEILLAYINDVYLAQSGTR